MCESLYAVFLWTDRLFGTFMDAFTNDSLSHVVVFDDGFPSFGRIREFPIRFGKVFQNPERLLVQAST